jgi:hypothetical protein
MMAEKQVPFENGCPRRFALFPAPLAHSVVSSASNIIFPTRTCRGLYSRFLSLTGENNVYDINISKNSALNKWLNVEKNIETRLFCYKNAKIFLQKTKGICKLAGSK